MTGSAETPPLGAVLWDFDLTLADTRRRNLSVNRRIIAELAGRPWQDFPDLADLEAYEAIQRRSANWKDFYGKAAGLDPSMIAEAGRRWQPFQLEDATPAPLTGDLAPVLESLAGVPQAVVTQNLRVIVEHVLAEHGLLDSFHPIVGYEDVAPDGVKPAPDGLLACLERLDLELPASVLYVGDHEADVRTVINARRVLAERGEAIQLYSVAALFVPGRGDESWTVAPDFRAHCPAEVLEIARSLNGFP